ncbi:unnamed protein product [Rotaria sp. Silwood1]|nr:unnamed protein product [Rotaria sp. Silwood1]CAF0858280.1 unnamed protein product [Rotaria sp. Silwood1]
MASSMNKFIGNQSNKDEETYQLLEQFDHILKRSETDIGSNKPCLAKSTAKQAKEYFSNIDRYRIIFKYDLIKDDIAIQLAFNSSLSEDRKDLIKWHTEDIKQQREQNLPIDYLYKKKIQNKLI